MLRKNFIYIVIVLIGGLLVLDIILTERNNSIIQENLALQEELEGVTVYYDQIAKAIIHALDIGLRGYAIVQNEQFVAPMDNAVLWMDSMVNKVEVPLEKLQYDMHEFSVFKDSLHAYAHYCLHLKQLLQEGKRTEFLGLFVSDKGAQLYLQYLETEKSIRGFIDRIDAGAKAKYEAALARNQRLQIILFLIGFPTLLYTAFYTTKTFRLSELLRMSEADRNKILREQNILLEQLVTERMRELAAQNEEMVAQREELAAQHDTVLQQNRQLQEAQKIIETQNLEIHYKNSQLEEEVAHRTQELQHANEELIEHNNKLEQFAFIAAHNLRAPLTRILGLANLLQISPLQEDKDAAIQKLVSSTKDLDQVIKDLNTILDIKRQTGNLAEVSLQSSMARVLKMLEREREETVANVTSDFNEAASIYAVPPYVESILYNLISNAIKYRDPNRLPVIALKTYQEKEYILLTVTDNGLGIDLSRHKQSMFNLYKRFHLHMEGKGLGLYLVRTQIEAMGGKIDVESEPDKGTTFFVYFRK
jgi:signal transduction histidine kinase